MNKESVKYFFLCSYIVSRLCADTCLIRPEGKPEHSEGLKGTENKKKAL